MFISATVIDNKRSNARAAIAFLGATAFCGFFSAVYGSFSHGVSSPFMVYLAAVPFVLGVLPYTLLYLIGCRAPRSLAKQLYNWGVITLLVGSAVKGIVDISGYVVTKISLFGINFSYAGAYLIFGLVLAFAGVIGYSLEIVRHRQ